MKLGHNETTKNKFKELSILTVYGQYIYDTILIAKNFLETLNFDRHPHNTRNKKFITTGNHKLTFYEKKPSYIGLKFLRHLPLSIKNEGNTCKFKNKLKLFLVEKALYSLEEYFSTSL